jgi:histidinol-phosphatase (PHP family)
MNTRIANYHTHNHYCDGKEAPEAYVKKAVELNFKALGFSSHAPVLFENEFSISAENLDNYCNDINFLKTKYSNQIELFLALEVDYIPGFSHPFSYFRSKCNLDYLIGSVHLVAHPLSKELWYIDGGSQEPWDNGLRTIFGGDIRAGLKAFYYQTNQMLTEQKPEILGHFDKIKMHNKNRFFNREDKWYSNLIHESLHLIKETQTVMEINTRGIYKGRYDEFFPGIPEILEANKLGIPLMLNTDAHHPDELSAYYYEALNILKQIGIKELWHISKKAWFSTSIS